MVNATLEDFGSGYTDAQLQRQIDSWEKAGKMGRFFKKFNYYDIRADRARSELQARKEYRADITLEVQRVKNAIEKVKGRKLDRLPIARYDHWADVFHVNTYVLEINGQGFIISRYGGVMSPGKLESQSAIPFEKADERTIKQLIETYNQNFRHRRLSLSFF